MLSYNIQNIQKVYLGNIDISKLIIGSSEIFSSFQSDPYSDYVVLLNRFNSNFSDSSTNNLQLFAYGSPTISNTVFKYGGGSIRFTGTNYTLITSNDAFNFGLNNFTVEFWHYPTHLASESNQVIFDIIKDNFDIIDSGILMTLDSANQNRYSIVTRGQAGAGGGFVTVYNAVPLLSTWNHVAVVCNNSQISLYHNGQLAPFFAGTPNVTITKPITSNNCALGVNYGVLGLLIPQLSGYIDDFRITKGIARYTSNFTSPTQQLPDPSDPYINNVSLLLHMDGVNNSQTFIDSSTNNFTLTAFGNAQINTNIKKFGSGAAYFDGSGDYIEGPLNSAFDFGSGNFTIEGWFNTTVGGTIIARWSLDGANKAFFVGGLSGTLQFYVNDFLVAQGSYISNQWNHFATVRNGTSLLFFINGNQVGATYNIGSTPIQSSNVPIRIGRDHFGNPFFNGNIDELRITKGVARYTSNFVPHTAPFVNPFPAGALAFWKLNETSGIRFDSSGNNRHLLDRNNNVISGTGIVNNAARFTGLNTQTLSSQNVFPVGNTLPFTLSFWINYPAFVSPGSRIITFNPTGNSTDEWGIIQDNNNFGAIFNNFGVPVAPISYSVPNNIIPGQWNHIVVSKDSSHYWKYYRNGTLLIGTQGIPSVWFTQDTAAIFIGRNIYGLINDGPPNGLIDAVGLWNRVLTDQEINVLYNNGDGREI